MMVQAHRAVGAYVQLLSGREFDGALRLLKDCCSTGRSAPPGDSAPAFDDCDVDSAFHAVDIQHRAEVRNRVDLDLDLERPGRVFDDVKLGLTRFELNEPRVARESYADARCYIEHDL